MIGESHIHFGIEVNKSGYLLKVINVDASTSHKINH